MAMAGSVTRAARRIAACCPRTPRSPVVRPGPGAGSGVPTVTNPSLRAGFRVTPVLGGRPGTAPGPGQRPVNEAGIPDEPLRTGVPGAELPEVGREARRAGRVGTTKRARR